MSATLSSRVRLPDRPTTIKPVPEQPGQDAGMTGEDTFARYGDVVADSLDAADPVSAEELAGRLHYSRAYVDRVVAAAAGESPGRFRRRILLERAAYRLLSADSNVLDIAVEAGYASHEAFTRAFQRSYGAPP